MTAIVLPYLDRIRRTGFLDGIFTERYELENPRGYVICMHGYSEGLYKYHEFFYYLLKEGYSVYALEARGHGRSRKTLARNNKVHIADFNYYVDDLEKFISTIPDDRPKYLFGHSMGGCICLRYLETRRNNIARLILSSPMLRLNTHGVPERTSLMIARNACRLKKGEKFIMGQVEWLEHNDTFDKAAASSLARYEYFRMIRLNSKCFQKSGASYMWLREALKAEMKARKDSGKISVPTLLFQAENDTYVDTRFFAKLEIPKLEIYKTRNTRHEVLNSDNRTLEEILEKLFDFLSR